LDCELKELERVGGHCGH